MNFLTLINGFYQLVSKIDFLDFTGGTGRVRVTASTTSSELTQQLQAKNGTIALTSDIFSAVLAEYETPGTTALFQAPAGAEYLEVVLISGGGPGGSGRQGAAGTVRAGGGGGAGGGITRHRYRLSSLATALETTVGDLYFSATIGAGGLGASAVTTADTSGGNGTSAGTTTLQVRAGTGGSDIQIAFCGSGSGQRGGGGSTTAGTAGTTTVNGLTANGVTEWSSGNGGAGTTGGAAAGAAPVSPTGPGGGSGGQGLNAANTGAASQAGSIGGRSIFGTLVGVGTAASPNAPAHNIPFAPGGGGAGGSSDGTGSRNGGNGYRGGGGGGGAGSLNGTPSGAGGNGGNGYAGLLWS